MTVQETGVSAQELQEAASAFSEIGVPLYGVLTRHPRLFTFLHRRCNAGQIFPGELIAVGENLQGLMRGRTPLEKQRIFRHLDKLFEQAYRKSAQGDALAAVAHLTEHTRSEAVLKAAVRNKLAKMIRRAVSRVAQLRWRANY